MIIELHMLQNFAPSCLNRDDTGAPKECEFGGYRRARISSQCIKRAIRDYFRNNRLFAEQYLAKRTLLIVKELVRRLADKGRPEEEARSRVEKALSACKLEINDGKTQYLLFLGESEISRLADLIAKHWDVLGSAREVDTQVADEFLKVLDGGKAVDLALFGRMIANLPKKNIDAACQVAHAISTNKVSIDFDYFTAVDDLQPEAETGARMLGTVEFSSACYYRYANIDLQQLENNLLGDVQLARTAWKAFIRAAVHAVPTGRQNSMSAQNPPDFILAVAREYGAWSLANAFLRPVSPAKDADIMHRSAMALMGYWKRLTTAYGNSGIKAAPVLSLIDIETQSGGLQTVNDLNGLIETLEHAIYSDRGG